MKTTETTTPLNDADLNMNTAADAWPDTDYLVLRTLALRAASAARESQGGGWNWLTRVEEPTTRVHNGDGETIAIFGSAQVVPH